MARKYKQIHRKEIDFSLEDWAKVEHRAAACNMKTGTYLRHIALTGSVKTFDLKGVAPLINGMRTISNNINHGAVAPRSGSIFQTKHSPEITNHNKTPAFSAHQPKPCRKTGLFLSYSKAPAMPFSAQKAKFLCGFRKPWQKASLCCTQVPAEETPF